MNQLFSKILFTSVFAICAATTSMAEAQDYKMSSLENRTLTGVNGFASVNSASDFAFIADVNAIHYIMPQFGVGGSITLAGGNRVNTSYSIGPLVEYFLPVANNQAVYGQAGVNVAGSERSDGNFGLMAAVGYRYFLSDDVALSAKLYRNWAKTSQSGSSVTPVDATNLLIGFAVFM